MARYLLMLRCYSFDTKKTSTSIASITSPVRNKEYQPSEITKLATIESPTIARNEIKTKAKNLLIAELAIA